MRIEIAWRELTAITPAPDEVAAFADELAAAYNDPRNAALLGNTQLLSPADVVEHYASLQPPSGYPFVLLREGVLAGDGDLRSVEGGAGELAFLIASPAAQGKGLGTRFAMMIHAFAFRHLGLDRVYAAVVPANVASQRVFAKLGYVVDGNPAYGDPGDIVLSVDRAAFEQRHADALAEIRIAVR